MLRRILGFALALGLVLTAPALAGQGKTELLWLGQSAFRIDSPGGKVILIDPFITQNPKTPAEWKDLDKLGKLDVILVTTPMAIISALPDNSQKAEHPDVGPGRARRHVGRARHPEAGAGAANGQGWHDPSDRARQRDHPGSRRAFLGIRLCEPRDQKARGPCRR